MGSPKLPALNNKFASKGHAEHLPFQRCPTRGLLIDDAFHRQQAVADKALFPKYLGKRRGQVLNSFGKILPKVGIYPRHWYSESLNYTWELNVLFLWVAYVNISQEQGFRKVEWKPALNRIQKRSNPVPIWIKCSSIVESDISFSPVFFSLLSQVLKTGQEIGFSEESLFRPLVRDRNWTWKRLDF